MYRNISEKEKTLLKKLIQNTKEEFKFIIPENLLVKDLQDGQMGSIKFFNSDNFDRVFGSQVSEVFFKDDDDVLVIATLYIDNYGDLFEIDVWKVDFSPTINFPDKYD